MKEWPIARIKKIIDNEWEREAKKFYEFISIFAYLITFNIKIN